MGQCSTRCPVRTGREATNWVQTNPQKAKIKKNLLLSDVWLLKFSIFFLYFLIRKRFEKKKGSIPLSFAEKI
jgi:hypothetical protein